MTSPVLRSPHGRAGSARNGRRRGLLASLAIVFTTTLGGCDIFHRWDAIVYVNKFDPRASIDIGTFDSLEACRTAARSKLLELKAGELGGYICGENCLVKSGFDNSRMCARTAR